MKLALLSKVDKNINKDNGNSLSEVSVPEIKKKIDELRKALNTFFSEVTDIDEEQQKEIVEGYLKFEELSLEGKQSEWIYINILKDDNQ